MRKLLSLIALFCVMAIGAGVSVSSANAATLTSAVQSLKAQQTGVAEKAYYRRGYHRGYYHRRYYRGYYHRGYGYGGYGGLSSPLLVALRSSHLPLVMSQAEALGLSPGAFFMQRLTLGRRDEA